MHRTIIVSLVLVALAALSGCTIMLDTVPHTSADAAFNRASAPSVATATEEPAAAETPVAPSDTSAVTPTPAPTATLRRPDLRAVLPPIKAAPEDGSKIRTPSRERPIVRQPGRRIHPKVEVQRPPIKREIPKPRPKFEPPRPDTRLVQRSK